jgi:antirestriction protein ArdC
MNIKDLEDKVTNQVIASLEAGVPPWHKTWDNDGSQNPLFRSHYNGESGHVYTGINWLITQFSGYASMDWYTKRGAIKATGLDKPIPIEEFKKGTAIVFYKPVKKEVDGEDASYCVQKVYTIWNREQIVGLPDVEPDESMDGFDPHTEIEQMLSNLNLKGGVNIGGDRACYVPSQDAICLPQDSAFTDENERESTKAHEGIHATGAKHRLDRKKESYAEEELVAELGAAMVCASLGVPLDKLQHTSYIQGWLKRLQNDKKFIFKAAAEANKAVQYLTREVA